jgi:hypothetical protein
MFDIKEIIIPGERKPPKEPLVNAIPEPLPRPYQHNSFRMMIVGPSGVGKSNVFVNMLIRGYMEVFSHILVFCPTFENDATLRKLTTVSSTTGESFLNSEDIYLDAASEDIAAIVKEQLALIDSEFEEQRQKDPGVPLPKTLMVFDDLTNEIKDATFMKNLFTKGRKHEISVIIITNKYREYAPQIRNNCTHFVFFKPATVTEEKAIMQDISGIHSPATIKNAFDVVFQQKDHPFIYIDKNALKNKYWYKFSKPITIA